MVDDDLDVKTIMDPWMYQMGLPVVNVTDLNNGSLYVSQSRFLNNPAANFSDPPSEYGLVFALIQLYSTPPLLSILTQMCFIIYARPIKHAKIFLHSEEQ